MAQVNANKTRVFIYMLIAALISIIILGILMFLTSNGVVKRMDQISADLETIGSGDFTKNPPEKMLKSKDEFGTIARSMQRLQNSMKDMIGGVIEKSQIIRSQSQELKTITHESERASDDLAKAIEEIAEGCTSQAMDTGQGLESVRELDFVLDNNTTNIYNLNNSTKKVNTLKDQGLELINDLMSKTEITMESTKEVGEVINETNVSAEKISEASQMIKSIAEQTNLLALNAAIEAARAGEAGRGFAVVAEEIRKLAEESSQFTQEIGEIIDDLISKTGTAVETVNNVGETISSQGEGVRLTSGKFDGIAQALEEMIEAIEVVNESSQETIEQKEKLRTIMENLAALSQENAAGTEESSASVQEQNAVMEEVSNSSDELTKIAEELDDTVERFKV